MLCRDAYHVLHFDLRIAGFADLASLYMSLNRQMEQYFEALSTQMEGYKEFEKEAWSFKVRAPFVDLETCILRHTLRRNSMTV